MSCRERQNNRCSPNQRLKPTSPPCYRGLRPEASNGPNHLWLKLKTLCSCPLVAENTAKVLKMDLYNFQSFKQSNQQRGRKAVKLVNGPQSIIRDHIFLPSNYSQPQKGDFFRAKYFSMSVFVSL